MSEEQWRDIPGYEGLYQVSDHGRVWSVRRQKYLSLGNGYRGGHLTCPVVSLYNADGKGKTYGVHRLVLLAFVGPKPEELESRHLNGDPWDNRLSNLAYGTHSENEKDKVRHGTHHLQRGILTHEDVARMQHLRAEGKTLQHIGVELGVCPMTVWKALNDRIRYLKEVKMPDRIMPDDPVEYLLGEGFKPKCRFCGKLVEDWPEQPRRWLAERGWVPVDRHRLERWIVPQPPVKPPEKQTFSFYHTLKKRDGNDVVREVRSELVLEETVEGTSYSRWVEVGQRGRWGTDGWAIYEPVLLRVAVVDGVYEVWPIFGERQEVVNGVLVIVAVTRDVEQSTREEVHQDGVARRVPYFKPATPQKRYEPWARRKEPDLFPLFQAVEQQLQKDRGPPSGKQCHLCGQS